MNKKRNIISLYFNRRTSNISNDSFGISGSTYERGGRRSQRNQESESEEVKSLNSVYLKFKSTQTRQSSTLSQRSDSNYERFNTKDLIEPEDNQEESEDENIEVPSYKVTELKFSSFSLPKVGKSFPLFPW